MAHRDVLKIDGADPLAAALDDVLASVGGLHIPVGVDAGDVAGRKPSSTSGRSESLANYWSMTHGPRT